jgi:hypothetical protein
MNNIAIEKTLFGGIEARGKKFVCAVTSDPPAEFEMSKD